LLAYSSDVFLNRPNLILKNIMTGAIYIYTAIDQVEADLTGIVHVFIPAYAFGDRDIIDVPFGNNWIPVPKNVPKGVCYGSSIGELSRNVKTAHVRGVGRVYSNIFGERIDAESKYKHVTVQVYEKTGR